MNFANPCPSTLLAGSPPRALVTLINTLLATQCLLSSKHLYPPDYGPSLRNGDEYDFIVVGSGSAGSVVADRLSENPKWKVLLLEAGDYPSLTTELPSAYLSLVKSKEDWGYDLENSKTSCLGMKNQKCSCPRGKVLGGTSSINGMLYTRGHRKVYDKWAGDGNDGWDYHTILKHFEKLEDVQKANDDYYGKGGDIKLTYSPIVQPMEQSWMNGHDELGYGKYNEEKPIGYKTFPTNSHEGVRYGSAKAFLAHGKTRPNLHVALNAHVTRLLVRSDLSVKGVEVRINKEILQLATRKEVILSAGAVNSPQILMNSGIGPEDHLDQIGIRTVKNLSVGQNLQDHPIFVGLFLSVSDDALVPKTPNDVVDDVYQYFRYKSGPLAQPGIGGTLFFWNTKNASDEFNVQLYTAYVYKNDIQGGLKLLHECFNFPDEVVEVHGMSNKRFHNVFAIPALTQPKSLGRILLRSKDPFDTPRIVYDYLSDENGEDLQTFLEAIRVVQRLLRTKALALHDAKIVFPSLTNCRSFEVDSDNYWRCALRNMVISGLHLAGSCKMGPQSNPDAVVDSRLRVHGMKGVRVIDASIMPKIVNTNPNAAVFMIGEKGASMIKEDWKEDHQEL